MKLIKTFEFDDCYELGVYETRTGNIRIGGCNVPVEKNFYDNAYQWSLAESIRIIEAVINKTGEAKVTAGAWPDRVNGKVTQFGDSGIALGCTQATNPVAMRRWFRKHLAI